MESHHLVVNKTARVYTLGQLTEKTENVWFALHGYAMLAQYFIKKFDELDLEKNFIVAPEGLSKFYQNGLQGRIGASWMTAEDREYEIQDYIEYLEKVYQQFIAGQLGNKKLIILGFSQGVSTLFRWANHHSHPYHKIIAWAGTIPKDILENYQLQSWEIQLYYGNEDSLFSQEQVETYLQSLREFPVSFQSIEYQGGHNISKEVIKNLM